MVTVGAGHFQINEVLSIYAPDHENKWWGLLLGSPCEWNFGNGINFSVIAKLDEYYGKDRAVLWDYDDPVTDQLYIRPVVAISTSIFNQKYQLETTNDEN